MDHSNIHRLILFFEGIVDAQPQPVFSWYFDDEEIVPGSRGFEDVEVS